MKKRKTLSFKLSVIFITGLVVAFLAGGVTTYIVQNKIVSNYTNARLKNSVLESSKIIESTFLHTKTTVEDVTYATSTIFPTKDHLDDPSYVEARLANIKSLYELPAKNYEDVCAYWIILNPDYTGCDETHDEGDGFFYVKSSDGTYVSHPVTNIKKYPETDVEHIGWWTSIKSTNKALWMNPYYNANVDRNMFSYIQPFFSTSDELLGAVGIDIDLNEIIQDIEKINEYDDGYSILLNKDQTIIYHKDVETFVNKHYVGTTKKIADLTGTDNFIKSEDGAITYRYNGVRRTMLSTSLSNGMFYGVSVRTGELRRPIRAVIFIPQIVYATLGLVFIALMYLFIRKNLKPLKELNDAVEKVEQGNMGVELAAKSDDEIGQLTTSFSNMITSLREKNKMISAMAFLDGLTGVKNKNAHLETVRRIDKQILEGTAKFAVCMLDVNNLKQINDNLGHEEGDKIIIGCCYTLCKGFSHSPVFRIGGDEFVAIIEGDDYENRQQIYDKLCRKEIEVKNVKYNFAVGMATFEAGSDHCFNDTFKRADQDMYLNKKAMKIHE